MTGFAYTRFLTGHRVSAAHEKTPGSNEPPGVKRTPDQCRSGLDHAAHAPGLPTSDGPVAPGADAALSDAKARGADTVRGDRHTACLDLSQRDARRAYNRRCRPTHRQEHETACVSRLLVSCESVKLHAINAVVGALSTPARPDRRASTHSSQVPGQRPSRRRPLPTSRTVERTWGGRCRSTRRSRRCGPNAVLHRCLGAGAFDLHRSIAN